MLEPNKTYSASQVIQEFKDNFDQNVLDALEIFLNLVLPGEVRLSFVGAPTTYVHKWDNGKFCLYPEKVFNQENQVTFDKESIEEFDSENGIADCFD